MYVPTLCLPLHFTHDDELSSSGLACKQIGAGTDSFFEYAFKAYVLLGDDAFYDVWKEGYDAIMT
jgi:hypothetical protein